MKKFIALFIVFISLVGCNNVAEERPNFDFTEKKFALEETNYGVKTASIGMIGDVLLHSQLFSHEDFIPAFAEVRDDLRAIDFLIANQESMPGGKELGLSGYPAFNSPVEILDALRDVDVDLLSIANNHTLDYSERGVLAAIKNIQAADFPYVGAYESKKDLQEPRIFEVNDITIGVLGYTYGTNGIPTPEGKDYLVNRIDPERITNEIQEMRDNVDVVVVSMHWGIEYELNQNAEQEELAQVIADAGGDVIFGHHPHVIQPFEIVEGQDGQKTAVFYSLGNFYSGQSFDYTDIGGIAKIVLSKNMLTEKTTFTQPEFIPTAVVIDEQKYYSVVPLKSVEKDKIVTHDWVIQHVGANEAE